MSSWQDPPAAVLFDAAGTLVELREPVGETYARFAADRGARVPAGRLDEAFGRVMRAAPPNAHPELDTDLRPAAERDWWRARVRETFRAADQEVQVPDFDGLFDALFEHYATPSAWRLCPGAEDALAELSRAKIPLGVVSNFDHRLPGLLRALGIAHWFAFILLPVETGMAKPAAGLFALAVGRLGLPADRVAYIGDDPVDDLRAAARAGLRSFDVTGLHSLEPLPALLGLSALTAASPFDERP